MANEIMSVEGQLVGMPLAGPESFSQQQLDYLKRALGVDETVLYDGGASGYKPGTGSAATNVIVQLSEAITNFDRVRIYLGAKLSGVIEFRPDTATTSAAAGQYGYYHTTPDDASNTTVIGLLITIVENDTTKLRFRCGYSNTWSAAYRSGEDWGYYILYKIVGINRIAGGN